LFVCCGVAVVVFFFFFNDTATTEIYTLSLHDALPIWVKIRDLDSKKEGWIYWGDDEEKSANLKEVK